jgi:predicted transcriptional regulator of viral defense system
MEGSCAKRPSCGRHTQDPLDRAIAARAQEQHGVVAGRQLVALGLSASATRSRVTAGRLHRVHHGVFAVGHPVLTQYGRFMAAVLACGPGAFASHWCSSALLELGLGLRRLIDVTAPGSRGRTRDGIRVHSAATLTTDDVTVIENIPCTTLARTLLDIAEAGARREVERALDRAEQEILDMTAIDDVLDRANGRRGAKLLRAVLAEHRVGSTLTRNDLEEALLAICRAVERPPDAVNAWIPFPDGGGAEADFLWREQRLIVEVDGRSVHATRRAFGSDRLRDQRLMLLGWRVVRFTRQQVTCEPAYVAATLRGLLDHT